MRIAGDVDTGDPVGVPTADPGSPVLRRALAEVRAAGRLADDAGRVDLVARLDQVAAGLMSAEVPVAVVGEFKQGKSTLVNALLRTDVCPVDTDVVTSV